MKLRELIDRLNKHPNKEAEVIIKGNLTNVDIIEYDVNVILDIYNEDDFNDKFIELIVYNKRLPIDFDNSIDGIFHTNDRLSIYLDSKFGILIADENGNTAREIDLKLNNTITNKVEIIKKLQQIL